MIDRFIRASNIRPGTAGLLAFNFVVAPSFLGPVPFTLYFCIPVIRRPNLHRGYTVRIERHKSLGFLVFRYRFVEIAISAAVKTRTQQVIAF
jgi:hypothetical protein